MRTKQIILLGLVMVSVPMLHAQVVTWAPETPVQGETITVGYNPAADGAVLGSGEDVYCKWVVFHEDLGYSQASVRMVRSRGVFSCRIELPENAAFLTLYFITLKLYDGGATRGISIYRPDGRLGRGAIGQRMVSPGISPQYMDYFTEEMQNHPDNVSMYIDKWLLDSFIKRAQLETIVTDDLKKIVNDDSAAEDERLAARAVAYIFLKQEEHAEHTLRQLLSAYPDSRAIPAAADKYLHHAAMQEWKGEGPEEMKRLIWKWIDEHPSSRLSKTKMFQLDPRENVSREIIEHVCTRWQEDEPDNPLPFYTLAVTWIRHGIRYRDAEDLLETSLDLLLRDSWRLYEDIGGKGTPRFIRNTCLRLADVTYRIKSYAKALAWIQQAVSRSEEGDTEIFMLKAAIHHALGDREQAAEAYRLAWNAGSAAARDTLEQWYLSEHGSLDGFEESLGLKEQPAEEKQTEAGGKKPAPDFDVTTLSGEKLSLAGMKEKVVVLNFWGTGCSPCKKEIPELNDLVEKYQGRDIVFIAIAPDFPKQINAYLEKQEFLYLQVSGPKIYSEISRKYRVRSQPTHIFIDRNGYYDCRLTGGKNVSEIVPIIERLLNERR